MDNFVQGDISGVFSWAHLVEAEEFNGKSTGKLSLTIQPSLKDAQELLQKAQEVFDDFKASSSYAKRKLDKPFLGVHEDNNGDLICKFVMNKFITTKAGKKLEKKCPVFDGQGKPVPKKVMQTIGNGSTGIIAYQLYPFINNANIYGVSMRMLGVQLLKYVPYGEQDASSLGFAKHDDAFSNADVPEDDSDTTDDALAEEENEEEDIPFDEGESTDF